MGNILFSVGGLVLFHKTLINPCTLSVEDVFPLHVYPFFPFFRVPTQNSRRFGWILPLLLFSGFFRQTYCNSRENRVYYRQRLRKTIVFRVWCREVPVGARHSRGFFRRKSVSTFQAAGEEPEVRALYRTVEWFRSLSEQFGWQHGAYSSHIVVDGYAFFIPGEEFLTLL